MYSFVQWDPNRKAVKGSLSCSFTSGDFKQRSLLFLPSFFSLSHPSLGFHCLHVVDADGTIDDTSLHHYGLSCSSPHTYHLFIFSLLPNYIFSHLFSGEPEGRVRWPGRSPAFSHGPSWWSMLENTRSFPHVFMPSTISRSSYPLPSSSMGRMSPRLGCLTTTLLILSFACNPHTILAVDRWVGMVMMMKNDDDYPPI